MQSDDFSSLDPLVGYQKNTENFNDFDNVYTKFYKHAFIAKSPISTVILLENETSNEVFTTYAEVLYNNLTGISTSSYGEKLVEVDTMITNKNNTVKKYFFIYDFCRVVYNIGVSSGASKEIIYKIIIDASTFYAKTFLISFPVTTSIDLIEWMSIYKKRYRYEVFETAKTYFTIIKLQNKLRDVNIFDWFHRSEQTILNNTYMLTPRMLSGEEVKPEIGDFIFDGIHLSERMPYASYNNGLLGENNYKIYTGTSFDQEPDYQRLITSSKRGEKDNIIEFTLWLGSGTIYKTTDESFFRGVYNLSNNTIIYSIPITLRAKNLNYDTAAHKIITESFKSIIDVGTPTIIQSKVEFNLYPLRNSNGQLDPSNGQFSFDEFIILHHLSLDDMYRNILAVDEVTMPYPKRERYKFLYKDMFSSNFVTDANPIIWSMTLKQMFKDVSYPIIDAENTPLKQLSGRQGIYLRMRVHNGRNQEEIDRMLKVLVRLLCVYYRDVILLPINDIKNNYIAVLGKTLENTESKRRADKINGKDKLTLQDISREGSARLKQYQTKYPQTFIEPFTKMCPSHKTPEIFDNEDMAKNWAAVNSRKYLPYMQEGKIKFWFVCPHQKYIYPDIVANRDPSTNEAIKYFPCCSDVDLTKPEIESDYNEFYHGKPRTFVPSATILKMDKFLITDEIGNIPPDINSYIKDYDENASIIKRGAIEYPSPNSFLHCILLAVKDPRYMMIYNRKVTRGRSAVKTWVSEREAYVRKIRKNLARAFNTGLVKQELYDIGNNEDIISRIDDDSNFFDPSIFYRIIEEIYKVNVFVFNQDGYEIPRHRAMSIRHVRMNRPTILIYKNKGPKIVKYMEKYPACELIVDSNARNFFFGAEMTELCYTMHTSMMTTLTISRSSRELLIQGNSSKELSQTGNSREELLVYNNEYYFLDYVSIFGNSIFGQHINGYGKIMALNIKSYSGTITVFVPPGQPLNIPETTQRFTVNANAAIDFFQANRISSITKNPKGEVDGIWFSVLDIKEAFYVEVTGFSQLLLKYPEGSPGIFMPYSRSEVETYREQERTISIIKQLVSWCFDNGRDKDFPGEKAFSFMSTPPKTSVGYYDLSKLRLVLPNVNSFTEAIQYVYFHTKNLINRDQNGNFLFVFHNQTFRDKIVAYLIRYSRETYLSGKEPIKILRDFRSSYKSFTQAQGVEIFTSTKDFSLWLEGRELTRKTENKVHRQVRIDFASRINPYIYMDQTGRMFLIQNIEGLASNKDVEKFLAGEKHTHSTLLLTAVKIARTWRESKINTGYYTPYLEEYKSFENVDRVIVYGISKSGVLIPIQDPKTGSNLIYVLQYMSKQDYNSGRARFAAMLPIN